VLKSSAEALFFRQYMLLLASSLQIWQ